VVFEMTRIVCRESYRYATTLTKLTIVVASTGKPK